MAVVLGIDAAWTPTKPSGVALVVGARESWRCFGAAPSYSSFLDLADGRMVDWEAKRFDAGTISMDAILAAARRLAGRDVDVVAIDMPMAKCAITGRRAADTEVSREFGSRRCAAHSPTSDRPGETGATIVRELEAAGCPLRVLPNEAGLTPALIEAYTHPALLSLLRRPERVRYEVARSGRYWPADSAAERERKLMSELAAIHAGLTGELGELRGRHSFAEPTCREHTIAERRRCRPAAPEPGTSVTTVSATKAHTPGGDLVEWSW